MKHLYLLVTASLIAFQAGQVRQATSCDVEPSSVVGRSSSGLAQVSNLGLIHVQARIVPARPLPPSGVLQGLKVDAGVYAVATDKTQRIVPSAANETGGGGDRQSEYVSFTLDVPIDPLERDAAIRQYLAGLGTPSTTSPEAFVGIFRQHRVGRFHIECRVIDEGRTIGVGQGDLEVVFKGRFFDQEVFRKR